MKTAPMPLAAALKYAASGEYRLEDWTAAERAITDAGLCPHCACEGTRSRLNKWQPGNYWENAGRECPNCEEFIVCGEQPEYGNAGDEWRGDADPGC